MNIQVNKVYNPQYTDTPYAVEILTDCSAKNPTQGGSEIEWFATKAEQTTAYNEAISLLTNKE